MEGVVEGVFFGMSGKVVKERLDALLAAQGLFDSREQARRAIMAGKVSVGGRVADKPGSPTAVDAEISVASPERFVGRGGLKLDAALEAFGIPVEGRVCLDVGCSTGGFTDCLLQRGAARVHAIDVGHGQVHWRLRGDPRVCLKEGLNARNLAFSDIGEAVDLAVADVSFISLALILPPVFGLLTPSADMVVLIKPQFELSPGEVGRGGVVKDEGARNRAAAKIQALVVEAGRKWMGCMDCPVPGREGNVEFLAHLRP
jgi:23S rRNA (cytidine1920-2'-O)/16S rRNA (cytidine1409-2'-O)-methyltransferase